MLMAINCFAGAMLTGCTSGGQVGGGLMTPDDVLRTGHTVYSAAQQVLGADGWSLDEQWYSCGLHDGRAEVQLRLDSRLDAALDDAPEERATRVREAWSRLGIHATLTVNSELQPTRYIVSDPPFLAGANEDGAITEIWVDEGLAYFSYVSPCVQGDIFKLQPELNSSREATISPPSSP
ncbi:hypothetical protein AB0O16_03985 [Microbacterium sp. NPDC089180]|uniref:hypothetical protein n=1 Tax=unclassified Microbacterium TaxID=2609290 RepID=UPI003439DE92